MSFNFFDGPGIVAGGVAYAVIPERRIACPWKVGLCKKFFVSVAFNQLHGGGVAFFEHCFCGARRRFDSADSSCAAKENDEYTEVGRIESGEPSALKLCVTYFYLPTTATSFTIVRELVRPAVSLWRRPSAPSSEPVPANSRRISSLDLLKSAGIIAS